MVPAHTSGIDSLGSLQYPLGRRLIGIGVDTQTVDRPVAQQINPQGGLGGVVGLLRGIQL